MCGIIITKSESRSSLLNHRGVDSSSIKAHGYNLCHHRLPIQTGIEDGIKQPMQLDNGGFLLYIGEIFNTPEEFDSDISYLFDLFNSLPIDDILNNVAIYWDGFWAIVYVSPGGVMYAFTDPLGKKQLYYNEYGEICSEIRPLLRGNDFDPLYKSSVYKWGYNTNDLTPWKGVKRITPNRLYTFVAGDLVWVSPTPYYDWNICQPQKSLEELIYEAVGSRLISKNYNIGVLVSGGLDSAIIAYHLKVLGAKVNYYSVENNESHYAGLLALYLGIDLNWVSYDVEEEMEESLRWNETPIDLGSVIPQHKLMGAIPEKIVLTGDGADELFGGYRRIETYDSQQSDVFEELPYYHMPRLDRASMRYTIELRSPFLSHDIIKYALVLPYKERINKKHLKDCFRFKLPDEILDRKKLALKNNELVKNADQYKDKVFDMFYNKIFRR